MITFTVSDVHAQCMLRALRTKREHVLSDRDALMHQVEHDGRNITARQALDVLNTELTMLDEIVDDVWREVAAYTARRLRDHPHETGPFPPPMPDPRKKK